MFSVNWGIVAADGSLHNCIPEHMASDNGTSGNYPGNGLWPFHPKGLRRKAALMGKDKMVQVEKSMYCRERTALSSTAVNPKLFS